MKNPFKFLLAAACFCFLHTAFGQTPATPKPATMLPDFTVVFEEMPRQGQSYPVDLSQVTIKEEKLLRDVLAKGDSRLSAFTDLNFSKKTATIILKEEIQLPSKFNLESWNQYFSQMARVMQTALPKNKD